MSKELKEPSVAHKTNVVDRSDEPSHDMKADPWSAPWNEGYRNMTDEEWIALSEASV